MARKKNFDPDVKLPLGDLSQYPNCLLIKDCVWQLKFCRQIESGSDVGACEPNTKTIYNAIDQSRSEKFYTLIHEVIHAIEDEYGFKLRHSAVEKLERGVGDFILENFNAINRIVLGD